MFLVESLKVHTWLAFYFYWTAAMYTLGLVYPTKTICPFVNSFQKTDTTSKDGHSETRNLQFTQLDSGSWKTVQVQEWELFLRPLLFGE